MKNNAAAKPALSKRFASDHQGQKRGHIARRLACRVSLGSRKKKIDFFFRLNDPRPDDAVLDVGVSPRLDPGENFFERWYPYPERIVAVANEDEKTFADFRREFPKINVIFADGKALPFADNSFDIVFSNAVLEHVGSDEMQELFVHEAVRVGKRIFLVTPNNHFPLDSHTLLPLVHLLPRPWRRPIYRLFGKAEWADIDRLNLLSKRRLKALFPTGVRVDIYSQRLLGMAHSLVAVVKKESS